MTLLLVAAGAVVALGAGVAVGARDGRTAVGGALVALVFSPFLADPLPALPVALFRIVAGVLAAYLLHVACRRADGTARPWACRRRSRRRPPPSPSASAPPRSASPVRPDAAVGAGLACLAVALPPVIRARDAFRLGIALVVLATPPCSSGAAWRAPRPRSRSSPAAPPWSRSPPPVLTLAGPGRDGHRRPTSPATRSSGAARRPDRPGR